MTDGVFFEPVRSEYFPCCRPSEAPFSDDVQDYYVLVLTVKEKVKPGTYLASPTTAFQGDN